MSLDESSMRRDTLVPNEMELQRTELFEKSGTNERQRRVKVTTPSGGPVLGERTREK